MILALNNFDNIDGRVLNFETALENDILAGFHDDLSLRKTKDGKSEIFQTNDDKMFVLNDFKNNRDSQQIQILNCSPSVVQKKDYGFFKLNGDEKILCFNKENSSFFMVSSDGIKELTKEDIQKNEFFKDLKGFEFSDDKSKIRKEEKSESVIPDPDFSDAVLEKMRKNYKKKQFLGFSPFIYLNETNDNYKKVGECLNKILDKLSNEEIKELFSATADVNKSYFSFGWDDEDESFDPPNGFYYAAINGTLNKILEKGIILDDDNIKYMYKEWYNYFGKDLNYTDLLDFAFKNIDKINEFCKDDEFKEDFVSFISQSKEVQDYVINNYKDEAKTLLENSGGVNLISDKLGAIETASFINYDGEIYDMLFKTGVLDAATCSKEEINKYILCKYNMSHYNDFCYNNHQAEINKGYIKDKNYIQPPIADTVKSRILKDGFVNYIEDTLKIPNEKAEWFCENDKFTSGSLTSFLSKQLGYKLTKEDCEKLIYNHPLSDNINVLSDVVLNHEDINVLDMLNKDGSSVSNVPEVLSYNVLAKLILPYIKKDTFEYKSNVGFGSAVKHILSEILKNNSYEDFFKMSNAEKLNLVRQIKSDLLEPENTLDKSNR